MTNDRLSTLMKKSEIQYVEGSPLLLEAYALYLDIVTKNCIAQLKWKSIDPKTIKAVMIELDGFDAFDQRLEPVTYQYDGLVVTSGIEFGSRTAIPISSSNMVRYDVILKAVSFIDSPAWRSEKDEVFAPLPESKPQLLTDNALEQFKRDLASQGIMSASEYQPQTALGLWQCGCGSWQSIDAPCLKCRATQEKLAAMADPSTLEANLSLYIEEKERLRIEAQKKRTNRQRETCG